MPNPKSLMELAAQAVIRAEQINTTPAPDEVQTYLAETAQHDGLRLEQLLAAYDNLARTIMALDANEMQDKARLLALIGELETLSTACDTAREKIAEAKANLAGTSQEWQDYYTWHLDAIDRDIEALQAGVQGDGDTLANIWEQLP